MVLTSIDQQYSDAITLQAVIRYRRRLEKLVSIIFDIGCSHNDRCIDERIIPTSGVK